MKKFTFEPSYDAKTFDKENPKEIEHHFYGSNAFEWYTDVDFQKVYNWFAKQGHTFNIHFVPVHAKADYQIVNYVPHNVDAHWLGQYHPK
jgi:hypothetical protein|tara:strand:+ start:1619 stop:1888 length:270 start_codon:yes stop_codon:yes gene_type:complete